MADQCRFAVSGLGEKLLPLLSGMGERVVRAAAQRLNTEAEVYVMTPSKGRCPVETGALRASGHVDPPEVSGSKVVVTVGYGGSAAPYALYVHERLEPKHPVGQAKFLESVMNENGEELVQRVIRAATEAIG